MPETASFSPQRRWVVRLSLGLFLLAILTWIPGCPSGPSNVVKGKVTLDDKPVHGTVKYVGADGKDFAAPINPDGTYMVANLTPQNYKITVFGGLQVAKVDAPKDLTKDAKDKGKDVSINLPGPSAGGGVDPPRKYEKAETSELSLDYKGGSVTKDLILSK